MSKIYIDKNFQGHILIAEVAACNLGGCSSFENVKKDKNSEYFDLLLILNKEEEIVTIKILDYFSDYGYEITSKNYLKKYLGKQPCDFKNEIDGIDAISGATISSYALEGMISTMCEKL
ncbi:MAG: FMN-binding protein [Bacteroidia bacterium]|nr:FMN-binding protein [Bacteroidia bacterium]